MKSVKIYSSGGFHDTRTPRQREMDRKKKAAKMKQLEAQIAKVKGTPAAKPLVEQYRSLTGTK